MKSFFPIRPLINMLHQAAQEKIDAAKTSVAEEVGFLQGRRYLVILEGKLGYSQNKKLEVISEDLNQFVNEKLKDLRPYQATPSEVASIKRNLRKICEHLRTRRFMNPPQDLVMHTLNFLDPNPHNIKKIEEIGPGWMEGVNAYNQVVWKKKLNEITYGREAWVDLGYISIGKVPPPPEYVEEIVNGELIQTPLIAFMKAVDPFYTDGRLRMESQRLIYVPPGIYLSGPIDEPENLEILIQKRTLGNPFISTGFRNFDPSLLRQFGGTPVEHGYWALVTVDLIEGTRDKHYSQNQSLVRTQPGYDLPELLPLSICVFFERIRTGKIIYGNNPTTYTYVKEKIQIFDEMRPVVAGCSDTRGIDIHRIFFLRIGAGGMRKFFV